MNTRFLVALGFLSLNTTHAFAQNEGKFNFSGYWRAGFNTSTAINQKAASTQGGINAPVSRHVRDPNYFRFTLSKDFTDGMHVELGVDSPNKDTFPHSNNVWEGNGAYRTRDLFVALPIDSANKIWAGSRRLEYEDVRLFDIFPLSMQAFGVGGDFAFGSLALSSVDSSNPNDNSKATTVMYRKEIALSEGSSLKPTLFVTSKGNTAAYDGPGEKDDVVAQKAVTDYRGGFVYSLWGDGYWSNNFLVVETMSAHPVESKKVTNTKIGVYSSSSVQFGDSFAAVAALAIENTSYQEAQPPYKKEGGVLVKDETKTAKTKNMISAGVQPVYFATDRVHIALDLNSVTHTKKLSADEANALLVTPIVRYAFAKTSLGTPQIYTSMTYGKYDAKIKKDSRGNPKDTLVTSQTGFEVWF